MKAREGWWERMDERCSVRGQRRVRRPLSASRSASGSEDQPRLGLSPLPLLIFPSISSLDTYKADIKHNDPNKRSVQAPDLLLALTPLPAICRPSDNGAATATISTSSHLFSSSHLRRRRHRSVPLRREEIVVVAGREEGVSDGRVVRFRAGKAGDTTDSRRILLSPPIRE